MHPFFFFFALLSVAAECEIVLRAILQCHTLAQSNLSTVWSWLAGTACFDPTLNLQWWLGTGTRGGVFLFGELCESWKETLFNKTKQGKTCKFFEVIVFFNLRTTIQQKTVKPTYLFSVRCQEAGRRIFFQNTGSQLCFRFVCVCVCVCVMFLYCEKWERGQTSHWVAVLLDGSSEVIVSTPPGLITMPAAHIQNQEWQSWY